MTTAELKAQAKILQMVLDNLCMADLTGAGRAYIIQLIDMINTKINDTCGT